LLEIVEASRFEYMAFRNAATALEDWPGNLDTAVEAGTVTEISAIGKGTAKVITDLRQSGSSSELQAIRAQVPKELPQLLRFRGLGPKRVKLLWKDLDVKSPRDLDSAIEDGSIASLKGFGAKTVESLRSSVEYFKNRDQSATDKPTAATQNIKIPLSVKASGKIICGTSGYSYPAWKGSFYTDKAKTSQLLKHYAALLPSVEINNTFYRFPSEKVVTDWKSQTSDDFQFALKANRRITHQMRLNENAKKNVREFIERCSILGSRLGCILFQLPPDFDRADERLNNLLSTLPVGPRYAIEFRHPSWFDDAVYSLLQAHNIACVCGDSEKEKACKIVTADFIYARLRKSKYTSKELDDWNSWFVEQQQSKRDVLVYLKHDETGDAPAEVKRRWYS